MLNKIWKDRTISNVKSVLYYGCETWKTTVSCIKKPQTFVNGCLRKILRIPWTVRVRNEVVCERTGNIPVVDEKGRRLWRWIGHPLRMVIKILHDRHWDGTLRGKREGDGLERYGEEVVNWRWKQMVTLGVISLRWLGIEMVGGCLLVAYILLGVKGNDHDDLDL